MHPSVVARLICVHLKGNVDDERLCRFGSEDSPLLPRREMARRHDRAAKPYVHHSTVQHHHSAEQAFLRRNTHRVPRRLIPTLPFIRETLERFPTLTAIRLYAMVREARLSRKPRSFPGTSIALHRPRKPIEAYLRLTTLLRGSRTGWSGAALWAHRTSGRSPPPAHGVRDGLGLVAPNLFCVSPWTRGWRASYASHVAGI